MAVLLLFVLVLILFLIIISFVLQFFFARMENPLLSYLLLGFVGVVTFVFLLRNILMAFNIINFDGFLRTYGDAGLFALILKVGFILMPLIIHLLIFFFVRRHKKKPIPVNSEKEMDKMLASDI